MDNLDKISKWMNDPELLYFDDDEPEPYEEKPMEVMKKIMDKFISSTPEADKDIIHFAIHEKESDLLIGYCMIAYIDKYNKKCKFGISIGDTSKWGHGYGKEVLKEIVRYSFEDLGMNRIGAEVYTHNERSIRLFDNIGFRREGIVRKSVLKKGSYVDEIMYGLLREEWLEGEIRG